MFKRCIFLFILLVISINYSCAKTEMSAEEISIYLERHDYRKMRKVENKYFQNALIGDNHIIFQIVEKNDFESFKFLIDKRVNINLKNNKDKLLIEMIFEDDLIEYFNYIIKSNPIYDFSIKNGQNKNVLDIILMKLKKDDIIDFVENNINSISKYCNSQNVSIYKLLYQNNHKDLIIHFLAIEDYFKQMRDENHFLVLAIKDKEYAFVDKILDNSLQNNLCYDFLKNEKAANIFNNYVFKKQKYNEIKKNINNVEYLVNLTSNYNYSSYLKIYSNDIKKIMSLDEYEIIKQYETKIAKKNKLFQNIDRVYKEYLAKLLPQKEFFDNISKLDPYSSCIYLNDNDAKLLKEFLYDEMRIVDFIYVNNFSMNIKSVSKKFNEIKDIVYSNLSDFQKSVINNFDKISKNEFENNSLFLSYKKIKNLLEIIRNYKLGFKLSGNYFNYDSESFELLNKYQIINSILMYYSDFFYKLNNNNENILSEYKDFINKFEQKENIEYLNSFILCLAIQNNLNSLSNYILEEGLININQKITYKVNCLYLPIHYAIKNNNLKLLKKMKDANFLLEPIIYGGVSQSTVKWETSLFMAYNNYELSEYLLKKGCDPNYVPFAYSVFHHSIYDNNAIFVELYLKYGADPNSTGVILEGIAKPKQIIFAAIEYCFLDIIKLLVEYNVQINVIYKELTYDSEEIKKMTPLDYAIKTHNQEIIDYLKSVGGKTFEEL